MGPFDVCVFLFSFFFFVSGGAQCFFFIFLFYLEACRSLSTMNKWTQTCKQKALVGFTFVVLIIQ